MKIAIIGAAGAIGRVAVPELLSRGHEVRVVGRDEARLRTAFPDWVEYVAADMSDPAQARFAVEGVDAILYNVGLPYPQFARHPVLMRVTIDAAKAAGVRSLIQIGTVYPFGRPRTTRVAETHPREPHTRKGAYRKEQEDLVLAAHDPSGLRTIVLRLPDFYGPSADVSFTKPVFDAARDGKAANVIAPLDRPHEYFYVPDVAPVIADLFERDDAFGTDYNLAGGVTTTRALVDAIFAQAGTTPRLRVATPPLVWLLGRVDPFMRELHEMLYLQSTPVILDDTKLQSVVGPIRRTPFDAGIRATVDENRRANQDDEGDSSCSERSLRSSSSTPMARSASARE
ncbi:MAG: hypothetical protein NVS3B7_14080 [Candidatus Elarobacter sp.]